MGIESSSQDQHRYRHDERPDNHQRTASELIHRENSQYGKRQVHRPYHDLLQKGGVRGRSHRLEDLRGIVKHHVDPHELLETGEQHAHQDDQHAKRPDREQQGDTETSQQGDLQRIRITCPRQQPVAGQEQRQPSPHKPEVRLHRRSFLLETIPYILQLTASVRLIHQMAQDAQRLLRTPTHHEITRRLRHEHQEREEQYRRNNLGSEHPTPADRIQPSGISLKGDRIIHEIYHQHTKDNGKLVPCHQIPPAIGRSHLGDIHRRYHGGQPHADTSQNTISHERIHKRMIATSGHADKQLRPSRADSGKQEKDSGQYQRRLPAVTLADPPGERGAEDTSDQRATHHEPLQGVGLIQRKPLRLDEKLTQRLYRTGDHRRVIPKQQTSQGSNQG